MKIAFYDNSLCLMGTTVAIYDYANHNELILNNDSFIFYQKNNPVNDPTAIEKFQKRFPNRVFAEKSVEDIDDRIKELGIDYIFVIKGGWADDGVSFNNAKMLVQAVGLVPPSESHGDVYAYNSYWVSDFCSGGKVPAVPHMIDLPDIEADMRTELGIPKDAIVFGRSGGLDTWSLPFVEQAIIESLSQREDIFFVFQNTRQFIQHPRVIHVESTADMEYKTKFINTCDAMIHARHEGESFGLSCGEFSTKNKAVITWSGSKERTHISILGDKGLYYDNKDQVLQIFLSFKREDKDWNAYKEYEPDVIMKKFNEIYLKGQVA